MHKYPGVGIYDAIVIVFDGYGGIVMVIVVVFVVVAINYDLIVIVDRTFIGTISLGMLVYFIVIGSDADGDMLLYLWDFGDGGILIDCNFMYMFVFVGTFFVKVMVSDGKGGVGVATFSVTVVVFNQNLIVIVLCAPMGDVTVGMLISFMVIGSDLDGDTLMYAWDFGDLGMGMGAIVLHIYAVVGFYIVKVMVFDGKGGLVNVMVVVMVIGGIGCLFGFCDDFNGIVLDSSWSVLRFDVIDGGIVVVDGAFGILMGVGDIYQIINIGTNFVLRIVLSGVFIVVAKINHYGNECY